jgi:hypothetical protein
MELWMFKIQDDSNVIEKGCQIYGKRAQNAMQEDCVSMQHSWCPNIFSDQLAIL